METASKQPTQPTLLDPGFYLVHGLTHALHRVNGLVWSSNRRLVAQRELATVNACEWVILEVTTFDMAWGE